MSEKNKMILAGERGIKAMNPEEVGSMEIRNWNAVSAAVESSIRSLRHREPVDLVASLDQIEGYLQEVTGEIGDTQDTLDTLPPVSPIKKYAAAIFGVLIPPLREVGHKAAQRESASTRLKTLTRVNDKLIELRDGVTDQIDDLVQERLKTDGEKEKYSHCYALKNGIEQERLLSERLGEALKSPIFEKEEILIEEQFMAGNNRLPFRPTPELTQLMAIQKIAQVPARSRVGLNPAERIPLMGTARRVVVEPSEKARYYRMNTEAPDFKLYAETTTLRMELLRLKNDADAGVAKMRAERTAILNAKRLQILREAGMTEAAGLLEE